MFYPKCPNCRSNHVESAEGSGIDQGGRVLSGFGSGRMTGHAHPAVAAAATALAVGRFIYKRVPGGGKKRCTACGHHFN